VSRAGKALRRVGLVAVAAVLVTAGSVATAHADNRTLDVDEVKVSSQGFDLGGGLYVAGGLTDSASVEWLIDENSVLPWVTGELHLDNVDGECARVRLDYYTNLTAFLTTKYGGTVCADGNSHQAWNVDLAPHDSNKIGKLEVSVEHQLSNGVWSSVGSSWSTLNTYVDESVTMFSENSLGTDGYDFGDDTWDPFHPTPMGGGTIVWELSNGEITPHLRGVLHLNNVAGDCARMKIQYYADDDTDSDVFPELLTTVHGGTVCAPDNGHYRWSVDRRDYSSPNIQHVRVSMESFQSNGTWMEVDHTLSFFGT
jgi:hypothetical protein